MSLSGNEIKQKIDDNNAIIESIFRPNQFTLNNTVSALLIENEKLQQQCAHEYEEGYCKYCYKEQN